VTVAHAPLGEVADFVNGAAFKESDWSDEGLRIIRIQNLTDPSKPYNRTVRPVKDSIRVRPGDLLVSWSATLGVFEWSEPDVAVLNQHIFRVVLDESKVDKSYLKHILGSSIESMKRHVHGATMQHINRGEFLGMTIPLPPVEEQQRISAVLDAADALRAKRREALAKLDTLTQSIFLDMFGDPVENDRLWPRHDAGSLCEKLQIGPFGSLLHQRDYVQGGIPTINPMHIIDGKIRPGLDQTVSQADADRLHLYSLQAGDIVMGRRGEMGRCAIVRAEQEGFLCGSGSLFLRTNRRRILPGFLAAVIGSRRGRDWFERSALGQTMPNLNSDIVSSFTIGVPPMDLQERFLSYTESIKHQGSTAVSQAEELDTLFASLQQRAFRGEL
jgi:type I restriction enzyme S subunit